MKNHLFSKYTLGPITLDNRIVVSPMCQYMASNGAANDWHLMHYGNMSIGAGSLIIFEATHVSTIGRITNKCLGLYSDELEFKSTLAKGANSFKASTKSMLFFSIIYE